VNAIVNNHVRNHDEGNYDWIAICKFLKNADGFQISDLKNPYVQIFVIVSKLEQVWIKIAILTAPS